MLRQPREPDCDKNRRSKSQVNHDRHPRKREVRVLCEQEAGIRERPQLERVVGGLEHLARHSSNNCVLAMSASARQEEAADIHPSRGR
jgi:hypothetical protein